MKFSIIKKIALASSLIASFFFSTALFAAGPLQLCQPGQPYVWPNGGDQVPFNPDQGALGVLDNVAATQAVSDSFDAWAAVSTATINYQNAGQLPVDVDITNFVPFLQPAAPDGLSAIVFDDTGEIFDAIFGAGSGILGFAGPEWLDTVNCTITEGVSFLNGPAIGTLDGLLNLMVHEFGHYSNLAHTEVNGQIFIGVGDSSGPGVDNTFGNAPNPDIANGGEEVIATMYPFLFGGIDQGARSPHADDVASLSALYPTQDFASSTTKISGTILFGETKITGVNVIARNIDNPFIDAVSAISSDYTDDFSQANDLTGVYTIDNLTPGANYAVYVDEILEGGFSTPLSSPLPGPEEFYNGANESANSATDIVNEFTNVSAAAGETAENIDIIFNLPAEGDPLATGDDGNVEIPLPFPFCIAGEAYSSVFINGNGFITFGAADNNALNFSESVAAFLSGPPRIAGFWDDLSPNNGGSVFYEQTSNTFTVTWDSVPEFFATGSNTFSITIGDNSNKCTNSGGDDDDDDDDDNRRNSLRGADIKITHNDLSSTDGLVGVSTGAASTSGFEVEVDLTDVSRDGRKKLWQSI